MHSAMCGLGNLETLDRVMSLSANFIIIQNYVLAKGILRFTKKSKVFMTSNKSKKKRTSFEPDLNQ